VGGMQVGPRGRNQRVCAVGQHKRQMELAGTMRPAEDVQDLSFKRVSTPDDRYSLGTGIEVMMGSLSSGLSN
jgi:hypothetical protein